MGTRNSVKSKQYIKEYEIQLFILFLGAFQNILLVAFQRTEMHSNGVLNLTGRGWGGGGGWCGESL